MLPLICDFLYFCYLRCLSNRLSENCLPFHNCFHSNLYSRCSPSFRYSRNLHFHHYQFHNNFLTLSVYSPTAYCPARYRYSPTNLTRHFLLLSPARKFLHLLLYFHSHCNLHNLRNSCYHLSDFHYLHCPSYPETALFLLQCPCQIHRYQNFGTHCIQHFHQSHKPVESPLSVLPKLPCTE